MAPQFGCSGNAEETSPLRTHLIYSKTEAEYLNISFLYIIFYILKNGIGKYTWFIKSKTNYINTKTYTLILTLILVLQYSFYCLEVQ